LQAFVDLIPAENFFPSATAVFTAAQASVARVPALGARLADCCSRIPQLRIETKLMVRFRRGEALVELIGSLFNALGS